MNKGVFTVGIIMLAIMALAVVNVINNYSSSNEMSESLLRDTVEAAMLDAVDLSYYRISKGIIRMDKEIFVENFTRRFAQNVSSDKDYQIKIYDIYEIPPKVTIQVGSSTTASFEGDKLGIVNQISGILETNYTDKVLEP